MRRPMQAKILCKSPEPAELLDAIDEAMSSVENALEALKGYSEFGGHFDALLDVWDAMKPDHDMYEDIAGAQYEAEIAQMNRDYERSVL